MPSFELQLKAKDMVQNLPSIICITGTSTGVGKTILTGLLARESSSHQSVVTQKWVQSGDLDAPDVNTHDALSGIKLHSKWKSLRQVYSFKHAVSPHLAAALSETVIDVQSLLHATHALSMAFDRLFIETSGGIMVPLTIEVTFGDLVSELQIPIIVVVPNELGCINHALLTFHYLHQKNIPILGFFMNQFNANASPIHHDNPAIISSLSGVAYLGDIVAVL